MTFPQEIVLIQHPFVNIAVQAARSASKILLRFMDHIDSIEMTNKVIDEFITEVYQLVEQDIIQHIQKAYREHAILGEECGLIKGNEYCWIIDPLDGIMNYAHSLPHFTTSIAVKKNDKIEAGIVYDPIQQELFTASRGKGAYLNNRRIRVSDCKKLKYALIGTGFPFRRKQHIKPYLTTFESIFLEATDIRRTGAIALDLAYVAAGRLDGFWEASLNEWDMAAGPLLIEEAGGRLTDFHAGDHYLSAGNIVAGNQKIQQALQTIIANSLKE